MAHSIGSIEGKPVATIAKHGGASQREMGFLAEVKAPHLACDSFITQASWDGVIRYAVQRSGKDDYEVADEMNISHGYMSRVMRGTAGFTGARLVKLMRVTGSIAPLQWIADQMGYELKPKQSEKEALKARLAQLEEEEKQRAA